MKITTVTGKKINCASGQTIRELFTDNRFETPEFTIAAKKDFKLVSLSTIIKKNAHITPVTMKTIEGRRIYQKSLDIVLLKAFNDIFPENSIRIQHSISKGVYWTADLGRPLTEKDVISIKEQMRAIIQADLPIEEISMKREDADKHFKELGMSDKSIVFSKNHKEDIYLSKMDGITDLRYFPLVPSTGLLETFDLVFYAPGMILRFPRTGNPDCLPFFSEQIKLFSVFSEDSRWSKILEVTNVGELNAIITQNKISELIKVAEALHEKKIASIADEIKNNIERIKFILIAGPSSSGKTTFSKRLAIQLRVCGIKTESISTDDYFKAREFTPRGEDGDYNFEDLDALDLKLFNEHLTTVFKGDPIEVPKFDFNSGKRKETGTIKKIPKEMPVIIEGIHCLNEELTNSIPRENKYLIYVSALTPLNIDNYNRIPTTDNRILRRIVRDHFFRGYTAYETIHRWPSVRRGEDKNIFPFQEFADVMFNSALIYELAVLRNYAMPLLKKIRRNVPEYSEAQRLINFLSSFHSVDTKEVPPTSILREFVGESSFQY